jgi:trypsin-like peptidase
MPISPKSSLLIRMTANGSELAKATGFVLEHSGARYLITNWHCLAGRDPYTLEYKHPSLAIPDHVTIWHNEDSLSPGMSWVEREETLLDADGRPLWLEHPTLRNRADIAAIRLSKVEGVDFFPYSLDKPGPPIMWGPSDPVAIIGFPFGKTAGGMCGIWVHGWVASEPDIDLDDLPRFLVDSRTRSGQSGSPVIAVRTGSVLHENGVMVQYFRPTETFLGVYSGRINEQSDLGYVWKLSAVRELIEGGIVADCSQWKPTTAPPQSK